MVLNPFLYRSIMDFFDERILSVLKDGKPLNLPNFWARWVLAVTR
jgi:hypothetical protein